MIDIMPFLFRKRTPLEEVPFITGCERHSHVSSHNKTGTATVSAILVRALYYALQGFVLDAQYDNDGFCLKVSSASSASSFGFASLQSLSPDGTSTPVVRLSFPHGEPTKITYHVGLLFLAMGLRQAKPAASLGFHGAVDATPLAISFLNLLKAYEDNRRTFSEALKPFLLQTADELYYFISGVAFEDVRNSIGSGLETVSMPMSIPSNVFTCWEACNDFLYSFEETTVASSPASVPAPSVPSAPAPSAASSAAPAAEAAEPEQSASEPEEPEESEESAKTRRGRRKKSAFIGRQFRELKEAVKYHDNILLTGPTGTGKTQAVTDLIETLAGYEVVRINGMEGMADLDIVGSYIPNGAGTHVWKDGPLLRAMRAANFVNVILFVDELTRIPRHFLNLFVGLMNPVSVEMMLKMGISIDDEAAKEAPFYLLEVPMTSEKVYCPASNLQIIAAGNFGRQYAVYELDPALRRRFQTTIEFTYLNEDDTVELLVKEVGLSSQAASLLAKMTVKTREMAVNGQTGGLIDTGSLLNWATKVKRQGKTATVASVMRAGWNTWADLVVGRDSLGAINKDIFDALHDLATTFRILPVGETYERFDV